MNSITHCPTCGKKLGLGATRCWTKGCDYIVPAGVKIVAEQPLSVESLTEGASSTVSQTDFDNRLNAYPTFPTDRNTGVFQVPKGEPLLLSADKVPLEAAKSHKPVLEHAGIREALTSASHGWVEAVIVFVLAGIALLPMFIEYRATGKAVFALLWVILKYGGPILSAFLILDGITKILEASERHFYAQTTKTLKTADVVMLLSYSDQHPEASILDAIVVPGFWAQVGLKGETELTGKRKGEKEKLDQFLVQALAYGIASSVYSRLGTIPEVSESEIACYLRQHPEMVKVGRGGVYLLDEGNSLNNIQKVRIARRYEFSAKYSGSPSSSKAEQATLNNCLHSRICGSI